MQKFYIPRWHTPKYSSFRANGRFGQVFIVMLFIRESKPRKSLSAAKRDRSLQKGGRNRSTNYRTVIVIVAYRMPSIAMTAKYDVHYNWKRQA